MESKRDPAATGPEMQEGTWVDEVLVITGTEINLFRERNGGTLDDVEVVDRNGDTIGRVARVIDSGPGNKPEAYVMPDEALYERMGEERGGNTLGVPATEVEMRSPGVLRLKLTLDELFLLNRERGGRPRDLDVARQLGVDPRK